MINKNILNNCHNQGFNERELYEAYKIFFGTLVSKSRLKIINLLRKKSMNVSEIVKEMNIDQTMVSHNLGRLKHCGFITNEKKGKYRYYKLNEKTIKPILDLIDKHMDKNCLLIIKGLKGGEKK